MPLINIALPLNALSPEQEEQLAQFASNALLTLEGMQQNPKAQMLSWVYFHKHPQNDYFIGGKRVVKPHYRFDVSIFANTMSDRHKSQLTEQLTQEVLRLEGTDNNLMNAARVWVMFDEVADGNWGGAGQIYHLKDLMNMMQSKH